GGGEEIQAGARRAVRGRRQGGGRLMRRDPHSWNDDAQPETASLAWRARVDFAARAIEAEAVLALRAPSPAGPLDLDTRDLAIEEVTNGNMLPLPFAVG